jgi:hypothetical protein
VDKQNQKNKIEIVNGKEEMARREEGRLIPKERIVDIHLSRRREGSWMGRRNKQNDGEGSDVGAGFPRDWTGGNRKRVRSRGREPWRLCRPESAGYYCRRWPPGMEP